MDGRGRKPKPTQLKLVTGNPGKRPLNLREPMPIGDLGAPPSWLTDSQRQAWDYALASAPPGLLKRLDQSVLVAWVVACDLHRQANEALAGGRLLIRSPQGHPAPSPYVSIINKQAVVMIRAASEMGFTPASRSRVEIDDAPFGGSEFFT